jgi:hypothetical protein
LRAQSGEYDTWVRSWQGASDDRGNEHTVGFGWYAALPFDLGMFVCNSFVEVEVFH